MPLIHKTYFMLINITPNIGLIFDTKKKISCFALRYKEIGAYAICSLLLVSMNEMVEIPFLIW